MFYAILPSTPAIFAVQPDSPDLSDVGSAELLAKLERHFMLPVALVTWNDSGTFRCFGHSIDEEAVTSEDLVWREFALPTESDLPF